jgi:hypothetical protein
MKALRWLILVLPLMVAATCVPAGERDPAVIPMAGTENWKVETYCGNPRVRAFLPGDKLQTALTGAVVFDSQGNGYVAAETFVAVVTRDGRADVLAGQPGLAGCTDGPPGRATFGNAIDIALVSDSLLYVADAANFALRRIERVGGVWQTETVAGVPGVPGHRDGPGRKAMFMSVFDSLTTDGSGAIYLFDGDWLRKFENGTVTTLNPDGGTGYANGPLRSARFAHSQGSRHGLTCDAQGNLYVADKVNMAIRKVDLVKGEVATFAGTLPGVPKDRPRDGPALEARFHPGGGPNIIFYDKKNDRFFVHSDDEDALRVIFKDKDGWSVNTLLPGTRCALCGVDADGNVYIKTKTSSIHVARNAKEGAR